MKVQFEILRKTRERFLQVLQDQSLAQLNEIPEGFNNNLLWNFAHVMVTQQHLTYGLAGLPFAMDAALVEKYSRGTKPDGQATQAEVDALKAIAFTTLEHLEATVASGEFSEFKPFLTGFGLHLETIDDALAFLPIHEGMHIGYAMALKRRLS
jgi:hypothetical protein